MCIRRMPWNTCFQGRSDGRKPRNSGARHMFIRELRREGGMEEGRKKGRREEGRGKRHPVRGAVRRRGRRWAVWVSGGGRVRRQRGWDGGQLPGELSSQPPLLLCAARFDVAGLVSCRTRGTIRAWCATGTGRTSTATSTTAATARPWLVARGLLRAQGLTASGARGGDGG
eukprot:319414-Rhodomonas_salina.1